MEVMDTMKNGRRRIHRFASRTSRAWLDGAAKIQPSLALRMQTFKHCSSKTWGACQNMRDTRAIHVMVNILGMTGITQP